MPVNRGQTRPSLKRKRNLDEAIKSEASRLAKTARNAGQKYTITDDDKKLLARHLAKAPREMSWGDSLFNFVEHVSVYLVLLLRIRADVVSYPQKEGAGRWSYPTWASMLRKEKEFFEREISILRRDATKMAQGKGKGKRL